MTRIDTDLYDLPRLCMFFFDYVLGCFCADIVIHIQKRRYVVTIPKLDELLQLSSLSQPLRVC